MGRDAQPSHPGYASPAQIVKPPFSYSGKLINLLFGSTEFLERPSSPWGEHERPLSVYAFEHAQRLLGEVHDVCLCVLCPIFRKLLHGPFKIEFVPGQACDFLATLAGKRQQFNNAAVCPANLSRGEYDPSELLIV